MSSFQSNITLGIQFLHGLESDHPGKYWEVYEVNHGDHRIWPQTQYLLYLTFKRFGLADLARRVNDANDFTVPTIDRAGLMSNQRYCVLDNVTSGFYLANHTSSNFDEVALIGHYASLTSNSTILNSQTALLKSNWNKTLGVLGMDAGDQAAKLFRVYKTALAGTLFARAGMTSECDAVATTLANLQEPTGGWITDLTVAGAKNPGSVANIETTALSLICLDCARKGSF